MPQANQVRIIGGDWRGRRIRFPARPGLRPTPDRVRETVFNWLGQKMTGRIVLDAFAGSGALSLEALSRGAQRAVALERDPILLQALAANARTLGTDALETRLGDADTAIKNERRFFDVIFLDPPFDSDPWGDLLPAALARLAPEGSIYAEAPRPLEPPSGIAVSRRGKAGQVHFHLLRRGA